MTRYTPTTPTVFSSTAGVEQRTHADYIQQVGFRSSPTPDCHRCLSLSSPISLDRIWWMTSSMPSLAARTASWWPYSPAGLERSASAPLLHLSDPRPDLTGERFTLAVAPVFSNPDAKHSPAPLEGGHR